MAEHSAISWTDATFNPWRGCQRVSEGCRNCYAETMSARNPKVLGRWGPEGVGTRALAAENYWLQPHHWQARCRREGRRMRVFCASLADVFEGWDGPVLDVKERRCWRARTDPGYRAWFPDAGDGLFPHAEFEPYTLDHARARLWQTIALTPDLDWLLLTKRPENIRRMVPPAWLDEWPANAWPGTTTEDQPNADRRIPELLAVPAAVRWLSVEPQLGEVNVMRPLISYKLDHCRPTGFRPEDFPQAPKIHWVITGGESGSGARPYDLAWPRFLRDQCKAAGIAFFVKQMGADPVRSANCGDVPDDVLHPGMFVNDERNLIQLRLKDRRAGADPAEWPADLRIQEFPDGPH